MLFEQKRKQRDKMRKKMHIFAIPKSTSNRTKSGCIRQLFALCMVAVPETAARLLVEPRTPVQRAFVFPKINKLC